MNKKNYLFLLLTVVFIYTSCNSQSDKQKRNETTNGDKESPAKPKVDIKVNRRYDKKGNLISYDSTYSSYYATRKGDKALMDSLFGEFKPEFNKKFPFTTDKDFNNLFFNDSLLYNDFFHNDFFKKRLELNKEYMQQIMQQMDSTKNDFFKKQSKYLNKK